MTSRHPALSIPLQTTVLWQKVKPSIGALCAIAATALICRFWLGAGVHGLPYLVAPMGASAVLLFALPASPLAQPWQVFGGNTLSALVGVGAAALIPDPAIATAVAVAAAIGAMTAARCLHPPGGAVAITAVLGGPAIMAAGWSYAFIPVGLNSAVLLLMAWAFHNGTRYRYPHRPAPVARNIHGTSDPVAQNRIGYTRADLDEVIARYDSLLDVANADLDSLFRQVEAQAHRRLHGVIRCEQIMSRDVICLHPTDDRHDALGLLEKHKLWAMPVITDDKRIVGIIDHIALIADTNAAIGDLMNSDPIIVAPATPIDNLLPLLSNGVQHCILIADHKGELLGMVTQTDLIAALWRGHVAEQIAATQV